MRESDRESSCKAYESIGNSLLAAAASEGKSGASPFAEYANGLNNLHDARVGLRLLAGSDGGKQKTVKIKEKEKGADSMPSVGMRLPWRRVAGCRV